LQARRRTDRTVDVHGPSTGTTNQVVVVVTHPVLVAGRRSGRLDTPEKPLVDQDSKGVVHPLAGDRTDLGPDGLCNVIGGTVRSIGHRLENGQPLSRDLDPVLAKEVGRLEG
jgi:hypothetical protein